MTTELANEIELIRKTYPILLHNEEFTDGSMHVTLKYSEGGNIVEAKLCWDANINLEDFVNDTCCNEYHLPIYLKETIIYQLFELVKERQLIRNDQITCDFFQSTFRNDDEHLKEEEISKGIGNYLNASDYEEQSDDDEKNSESDDDEEKYNSNDEEEETDNSEEDEEEEYSEEYTEESTECNLTETTVVAREKYPMDFSLFYKVFHSSVSNQILLMKISNDLRCVYQDKYQERDRSITQIQKEYVFLLGY